MIQRLTVTEINGGPLANLLCAKGVLISTVDGAKKRHVGTIAIGRHFMQELVTKNDTSSDEAMRIETTMIEMGMAKDIGDLRDRCKLVKLDPGSVYGFKLCTCSGSKHIPHGFITENDEVISDEMTTFLNLYYACLGEVNEHNLPPNEAIAVLQSAIAGDISLDPEALRQRVASLPPGSLPMVPVVFINVGTY